jgi:hypothetical protein
MSARLQPLLPLLPGAAAAAPPLTEVFCTAANCQRRNKSNGSMLAWRQTIDDVHSVRVFYFDPREARKDTCSRPARCLSGGSGERAGGLKGRSRC